jgi:hypothetical protein
MRLVVDSIVPGVQSVESHYLPTILQVLHFLHFQLYVILHAHLRLHFGHLALLGDGVCTLSLQDLLQLSLLVVLLRLPALQVFQVQPQLRQRDA